MEATNAWCDIPGGAAQCSVTGAPGQLPAPSQIHGMSPFRLFVPSKIDHNGPFMSEACSATLGPANDTVPPWGTMCLTGFKTPVGHRLPGQGGPKGQVLEGGEVASAFAL